MNNIIPTKKSVQCTQKIISIMNKTSMNNLLYFALYAKKGESNSYYFSIEKPTFQYL